MPYIDPITGAYVADSLDALPPGYNQPKANNEANVAQMRAALNNGWDDNTPLPQNSPTPATDPFSLIKHAYQNMPGASFVQGVTPALLSMPQFLASLGYGLGNQVVNPQTSNFDKDTTRAMQALQYTPPTQAGRDISEGIGKVAEATGPLPELWGLPPSHGFTPDDLRVAGRTATEDFRNFGSDYANAKNGVQREYPTAGSRAAQFTDVAGDMVHPMAEKAYDMYMNPKDAEFPGVNPMSNLSGLAPSGGPMYAVKPKGGNWPTNLGATKPLAEQGELGKHLSEVQYNDPIVAFEAQLKKHYPRGIDNRQLLADWEDFAKDYAQKHTPGVGYVMTPELQKAAADKFAESYNAGTIGAVDIEPTDKKLHTASQIAETLPLYNSWVMGPYQKYITNQMGTGLATDPLLQAVNESDMPVNEIFGMRHEVPEYTQDSGKERRRSFVNNITNYGTNASAVNSLENSPVGKITATTPSGVSYENLLDMSLYPKGTYAFTPKEGFPVSAKIDQDALITDFLNEPVEHTGFGKIRKQVFEDLLSGNISPDKLSNVTPATVTRQMIKDKMAEFKEAQLSKKGAADWVPKRAAAMPTDTAFDDGSKMTIITPEIANADEAMTARDLGQITIDLNQCVGAGCHGTQDYPGHGPYLVPHTGKPPRGKVDYDKYGYLRRLKNGEIQIASLKDPEGVSQATIRLDLRKRPLTDRDREGIIWDWITQNHPDKLDDFNADINGGGQHMAIGVAIDKFPELKDVIANSAITNMKSISEMKGKDNGDIKEEYIPQIVEWLNKQGNDLEDVRDLNHLPNVGDLTRTYDTIGNIMDKNSHWNVNTVENFLDKVIDENLLPRFFTQNDFALKATELGVDLSDEPKRKGTKATQEAYEKLSQQLRLTYEDPYLQEYANGDPDVMQSVNNDIYYHPEQYGMGNYTHGTVMEAVQRLRDEGLHTPGRELENVAQQFEAEPEQQLPFDRPEFPDALAQNMRDYFEGNAHNVPENMIEPYATETRILMGSQRPEARLPRDMHESIVETLLNQDDARHTENIRYIINTLQGPGHFVSMPELTAPQLENILNMVISWTERYPLNE